MILKKVKQTIFKHAMIEKGDLIVTAVSGGPDSVCLLHIMYTLMDEFKTQIVVAHFNHGLRPDDDDKETMFVKKLAEKYGLFFVSEKDRGTISNHKGCTEELARKARYNFLYKVKESYGANKIALGHNRNDQAETVLMRLLRGSGTSGLSGIPPCRDKLIIRPLIDITRTEIEQYLDRTGLEYITDTSNLDTGYLRNKIRLQLMPLLRQYQQGLEKILAQTAEILRDEDRFLDGMAMNWLTKYAETTHDGEIRLPLSPFSGLHPALQKRILRAGIRKTAGNLNRITLHHIERAEAIAAENRPNTQITLPGKISVRRSYHHLVITRTNRLYKITDTSFCINGPGQYSPKGFPCDISLSEIPGNTIDKNCIFNRTRVHADNTVTTPEQQSLGISNIKRAEAFFDADTLSYPLKLRFFRPGDRFIPLGMHGHKKLKDFFIDLKIPLSERKRIPILTFKEIPVWICGIRIDDRFKVTQTTRKVLRVTINKKNRTLSIPK